MEDDDTFKSQVKYFWTEKDDPTRYCYWDAARCRKLMPAFYEAWSKIGVYTKLAYLALQEEAQ